MNPGAAPDDPDRTAAGRKAALAWDFNNIRGMLADAVLPASRRGMRPAPSWPTLLLNLAVLVVAKAIWRGALLALVLWLIHRYWWPTIPALGFLPAVAIAFLLSLIGFGGRGDAARREHPRTSDPHA